MPLSFIESKDRFLLSIRVKPRARSNSIEGVRNGALLVSVTAAPSEGEANQAVIKTIAKEFGFSRSDLELIRGHKSREKTVAIAGVPHGELLARFAAVLSSE